MAGAVRPETTLEKMETREFDTEYIREWVFGSIKIVFLTIFKGFVNKAAY